MPTTRLCTTTETSITVRGHDLCDELMGSVSFAGTLLLLLTGQRPSRGDERILDAVLVTLMEHGMTPPAMASRLVYLSAPDSLQGALAAGLLAVGSQFAGTMEGCAALLDEMLAAPDMAASAHEIVARHRAGRRPVPGFGHPQHRPDDPRTPRLLAIAEEEGRAGRHVAALRLLAAEVDRAAGRHITINATGAIAALLAEIGLPGSIMRGVAVVSRSAGLLAHLAEEQRDPAGRALWEMGEAVVPYDAG